MLAASEIAAPLRRAYERAKAALDVVNDPRSNGSALERREVEYALAELVEAFEASEHALKLLVLTQQKDG